MTSLEIMDKLSPSLDKLLIQSRVMSFSAGESILYQSEVPRNAYLIKSGVVKSFDIGNAGDEKIVALATSGEFLPPAWVFYKSPVSLYYYSAFTDCQLYTIERDKVQDIIKSDKVLIQQMLDRYIGLYTGAVQQINALEQSKGTEKVLYILQYLVTRFGRPSNQGGRTIALRLTHQDIASMTGLTRETTTVELNRLKKKGIISYRDQHYTVNLDALLSLLGSADFMNYKY